MTTLHKRSTEPAATSDEAPLTLEGPTTRSLGFLDQFGMWGNLGVSLLGFTGAIYVLDPGFSGGLTMSFTAAVVALLVGTILGTGAVAVAAIPGAQTGAPAMVLLRGLFGARWSWLPSVLNIVQLTGWTTFELVTISTALHTVVPGPPRWLWVVLGGIVTTVLALWPLGWIRTLRKYVTVLVFVAMIWLAVQLLRQPLDGVPGGSWNGFWAAVDTVVGVSVSWVPVAADYSRHSTSTRASVWGIFAGYSLTQVGCYLVGMVALVGVAAGNPDEIYGAFLAVPLGTLAFAVLAVREIDQSFVDTYSATVSVQNLAPRRDRRVIAVVIGAVATVLTLLFDIADYENFLLLIASVFVPLLGVLAVDYFLTRASGGRWDLSERSRSRSLMLLPWLAGFVVYQWLNPGYVSWWAEFWTSTRPFEPQSWMSASILSFVVAAVITVPLRQVYRRKDVAAT